MCSGAATVVIPTVRFIISPGSRIQSNQSTVNSSTELQYSRFDQNCRFLPAGTTKMSENLEGENHGRAVHAKV